MKQNLIVIVYLVAIVAANLIVAQYGASVSIVTAFVFIGLDLTARDTLHRQWQGQALWRNMALLIATGSALSALININALPIAIASFAAFAATGIADTLTYSILGNRAFWVRVNGSNVASAAVDSLIFPMLAFGFPILWGIVAGQFIAKVFGGAIWAALLGKFYDNR